MGDQEKRNLVDRAADYTAMTWERQLAEIRALPEVWFGIPDAEFCTNE